ncbi:MAG: LPP20 family lipoprotein [Bacteroidota bacterium]
MSRNWKILKTITKIKRALFVTGCLFFSLTGGSVFGQLKKAPSWVREVPVTGDAFYGVGMVSMKDYPEYRAKARKMALREIVEKIFVSINSSSNLTTTYKDDEVDYLLNETVSLASSNFLMGHRKISEWIDKRKNTYYVLFSLDESVYKQNRKEYFTSFETVIELMQKEAIDLFEEGEIARSTRELSQSIKKIDDEINRIIEPEYSILLQKLRLKSIYELERQIDLIAFNFDRSYQFNATNREPLVIENFLVNKSTGIALNGLDLNLNVIQGDVFRYSFNHENHEALSIYGMFPQKDVAVIQIIAEVGLEESVKSLMSPAVKSTIESKPVVIKFNPYRVRFTVDSDTSFDREDQILNYFRNITSDLGLSEVSDEQTDMEISIKPIGSVKKQPEGHFRSDLSFEVSVLDAKNDRNVFQYLLPRISVKEQNPNIAVSESFKRAVNQSDDFLQGFVTALCALHF